MNKIGKHVEAERLARRAIKLSPKNPVAHYQLGLATTTPRAFRTALSAFSQAIKLQPLHQPSYQARGDLYMNVGQIEKGLADARMALKLNPANVNISNRADNMLRRAGHSISKTNFRQVLDPKTNKLALGLEYENRHKWNKAVTAYNAAVKETPGNSCAYEYRANAYRGMSNYKLAVTDYTRAIKLHPTERRTYVCRASCYEKLKQPRKALQDYKTATYIDPSSTIAARGLAMYLEKTGNIDGAIKEWTRLIGINPSLSDAYVRRADCHLKKQDYPKALRDYFTTQKLEVSGSGMIYEKIANVYEKMGKPDRAKKYRKLAKSKRP